jgi:hypothetical protein
VEQNKTFWTAQKRAGFSMVIPQEFAATQVNVAQE